ncbi:MAG: ATP-binding protein [Termitinemataceae bacterium]|nr:MAG: ATP-binding protein [Termitinemataceae bacterium]
MNFYNRESELSELQRIRELSFSQYSRMTVLVGRRRIGKTMLSMRLHSTNTAKAVYFFTARKSENDLCKDFAFIISTSLGVFVPDGISRFSEMFRFVMELGKTEQFDLVIDEFQEFYKINASVYSDIQNIWDTYKNQTHINLILSGSVYTLMEKIFRGANEPLFGRADNIIHLRAFTTATLKKIIGDYRPNYTNDDLLALYSFTGGVPKYVELFCDNKALSVKSMIEFMVRSDSPFIDEGKYLLVEEFGKNYGEYFSILRSIAGGKNTQPQIEADLGKTAGGYIKRLIDDYQIIVRRRPIMAKEGSQTVRYEIIDNFLRFWFNYFERRRSLIEIKNFDVLQRIIKDDWTTYSGWMLEKYFRQQLMESSKYTELGSWWEAHGNSNEIDIVAITTKNKAIAIEVKRQRKNFVPQILDEKVAHMQKKILGSLKIEKKCLTLEDM